MAQSTPGSTRNDRLLTSVIVLASMAAALAIRILWPYDTVFVDGAVWFREMDSWYRMRLVDNFIHNFPLVTAFDPYSFFPNGIRSTFHPLTSWLIGVPALLLGGGKPSLELVDACGAYFPPVLGALTVIPVYFIGRHLYGRVAGAMSAVLIAILPGEFLSRSLLGFTDHHVTEAFFSTAVLLFMMLALRAAARSGVAVRHPADMLNPAYRRTVFFAALAGISLGLYLLAWRGGLFVLAILVLYAIVRSLIDYKREPSGDDLVLVYCVAGAIAFLMASPTIAAHYMRTLYIIAMLSVPAFPIALKLLAQFSHRRQWSHWVFVGMLAGMLALALFVLTLISPVLAQYLRSAISFMVPSGAHLTIMEMHPLFFPGGMFSTTVAWNNFTTALGASLVALVVLVRSKRSPRGNNVTLFLVWSLSMLGAVLLQRRFGYYYAISAALLCGFLVGWVFAHPYLKKQVDLLRQRAQVPANAKSKHAARALRSHRAERRAAVFNLAAAVVVVVAILCVPAVDMARNFATESGLMTEGWYESLLWLRNNTPPPLEPDAYNGLYDTPPNRAPYPYPPSAYGVMAWWDYGHWITRLSHRIPVANPFQQGARGAGRFFMSQSEAEGTTVFEEYGCRYVIVDSKISVRTFHGVAGWAGKARSDYMEVYQQRNTAGGWESIVLYYPEYYQTMLVRLYNFAGQAYTPAEYTAIRSQSARSGGQDTREIVDSRRFQTYEEALAFLAQASDGNWRLISSNPLISAVPLEPLQGFSIEYESNAQSFMQAHLLPEVRIFRYSGEPN